LAQFFALSLHFPLSVPFPAVVIASDSFFEDFRAVEEVFDEPFFPFLLLLGAVMAVRR